MILSAGVVNPLDNPEEAEIVAAEIQKKKENREKHESTT